MYPALPDGYSGRAFLSKEDVGRIASKLGITEDDMEISSIPLGGSNPSPSAFRRRLDPLLSEHRHASRQAKQETVALEAAKDRLRDAEEAQRIVQGVAQAVQTQAHRHIASVVTKCLCAVFGEDDAYEFRINFERKRGRTEAELTFVRDGREMSPRDSSGGGAIDVASFALRLACLVLSQPSQRRLLVLDEPFKHLSRDFRPVMRELLMTLAKEMGVQFLIVTHDPALQVGKVVEL